MSKISLLFFSLILISTPLFSIASAQSLPEPLPKWNGVMGETLEESTPYFLPTKKPPKGAPNILVIMLDDGGFSQMSSFGGPINTPGFDRVAEEGLRFTHMTTTATCSPTRAALLSGRNHHAVGAGIITELSAGYPGYNNRMDDSTAAIAKILSLNGYSTAAFGKWHNTPNDEGSLVGPFDNWPTGRWGFDYFYGFLGGETNQFHPLLVENTIQIETPKANADGSPYHFTHDMADKTIRWLDNWRALRDQPFFVYWVPGAIHAPIHVPESWRDRYKGQFDDGWDAYRQKTFARQKAMGIFPEDTKLAPRPDSIPDWDSYSKEEKQFLARQMEITAAFMEHTDHQAKRIIDHLEQMGILDNTLIIYLNSDNGGSAEGTLSGSFQELLMQNGFPPLSIEEQMRVIDQYGGMDAWGGPRLNNHYSSAWGWASSTPYPWVKQMAGNFGTNAATAIRFPRRIADAGAIRHQLHHVTDIFPTILEITGVPMPNEVNGLTQRRLDGVSMLSSFDQAGTISQHTTQYFEMTGFHGIYHEGWIAAATPYRVPWTVDPDALANWDFQTIPWQLYDVSGGDLTQAIDVADRYPKKLTELQSIFDQEARRNNVYPIGASLANQLQPSASVVTATTRNRWVFNGNNFRIPEGAGPKLTSGDFDVTATVSSEGRTEGVIFAVGDEMGGMSLFIKDGRLSFHYSMLGWHHYSAAADAAIPSGQFTVGMSQRMLENKPAGKAKVTLSINGDHVAEVILDNTVPYIFSAHEPFDVGRDSGAPVSQDYRDKGIFKFTGKIPNITFALK